ncbi:MAG TPA: LysM peptidoglycan-binding domain-containing protein [Actinomycetota bacterium]
MTRTDVRFRRLLVLAVGVLTILAAGRAGAGQSSGAASPERVVVRAGDTLWGIAASLAGPGRDPRPVVHALRRANGLPTSDLAPGQVLVLP